MCGYVIAILTTTTKGFTASYFLDSGNDGEGAFAVYLLSDSYDSDVCGLLGIQTLSSSLIFRSIEHSKI